MKFAIVPVTPFQQNCTLLWCERTGKGAVVDPGGDVPRILAAVEKHGLEVGKVLLTHGHIDHAGGTAELARRLGVPVEGPQAEERFWIDALPQQSVMFGLPHADAFVPDRWLDDGDRVSVGEAELDWRWSATCCSPARSAAPTFRAATSPPWSPRSGSASGPWATTCASSPATGPCPPSARSAATIPSSATTPERRLAGESRSGGYAPFFFSSSRISRSSTTSSGVGGGGGGGALRFSRLICFTMMKMMKARMTKLSEMVRKLP